MPIQKLQGADKATLEVKPALANEGVGVALGIGKFGEDFEEELVGEEERGVRMGESGSQGFGYIGGLSGGGRERLKLHGPDNMLEWRLDVLEPEVRPA